MMRLLFAFCLMIASPTLAQDRLSAAEFDAFTKGKTLFYGTRGAPYGAEVYHDNRRVQWSFLDGECIEGEWYEDAGNICFVYENMPDPQCWTFTKGADGLIARFENTPQSTTLYDARDVGDELLCLGPKVGV